MHLCPEQGVDFCHVLRESLCPFLAVRPMDQNLRCPWGETAAHGPKNWRPAPMRPGRTLRCPEPGSERDRLRP